MRESIAVIAAERERQITEEGYSEEHDDTHVDASLAIAAAYYASPGSAVPWLFTDDPKSRDETPRLRILTLAGALIAAEMERIARVQIATITELLSKTGWSAGSIDLWLRHIPRDGDPLSRIERIYDGRFLQVRAEAHGLVERGVHAPVSLNISEKAPS